MSDRYAKQRRFHPIGDAGQQRLAEARVLVVGCGALGALAAEQLVRSGVGFVRIVDRDFVERSNLQRQALFTEADAEDKTPKAIAAASHLAEINSDVVVEACVSDLSRQTWEQWIEPTISLVVDGTDNLETRYLINEACLERKTPWVYGGCVGSQGQATLFSPDRPPCLRCLFPDLPAPGETETCDTLGVVAPAAHLVASLQVGLAMRALVETPESAAGRLLVGDVWDAVMRTVKLPAGDGCETCHGGARPFLSGEQGSNAAVLCGRNAVQITPESTTNVDFDRISTKLGHEATVTSNRFLLRADLAARSDSTHPLSLTVFRDGRVIVQGTEDIADARSAVAKYIGV